MKIKILKYGTLIRQKQEFTFFMIFWKWTYTTSKISQSWLQYQYGNYCVILFFKEMKGTSIFKSINEIYCKERTLTTAANKPVITRVLHIYTRVLHCYKCEVQDSKLKKNTTISQ